MNKLVGGAGRISQNPPKKLKGTDMSIVVNGRPAPLQTQLHRRIACFVTALTCVGAATAAEDPKNNSRVLEEVIVSAQKRDQSQVDVPISLSVLDSGLLDQSTDKSVTDTLNRIPGVINAVSSTGARTGTNTGVVVRGVAPNGAALTGSSTTGYYLDSIPFGFVRNSYAPDANSFDIQRVEVLRGPQGTLYGVSALNGVVRILTADANLKDFELKARVSGAGTENGAESYRGDLAVNVPLIEGKLGMRAVAGYQDLGGWIDKPNRKDANDARLQNYRLKVDAQPTEQLSLGLLAWFVRNDYDAPNISADGRNNLSPFKEPASTDYDAYNFKLRYLFPAVSVASTTSYIDYSSPGTFDFNPFNNSQWLLTSIPTSKVFAEELVLNSEHEGPWRWTLGGMYRDADDHFIQTRNDPVTGALCCTFQAPYDQATQSKSYAVFGEVTRAMLNRQLEVTVGTRYFSDQITDREISVQTAPGGIPPTGLLQKENDFSNVSSRAVVSWHPVEQSTIYASFSQGFRSGLNQLFVVQRQNPNFKPSDPDKLNNYEIGAKADLWEGRLALDSAVFYIDWKGVQQSIPTVIGFTPGGTGGQTPIISAALVNAGSASGIGAELGVTVRATEGLILGLNVSWNDLTVDEDIVGANGVTQFLKGTRLALSPEYTANASIDYSVDLGGGGYEGRFSTSASYRPEMIAARTTATTTFPAEAVLFVRASLGVQSPDNWTASIFADNLTNEDGLVVDPFSPRWNSYIRPRTIGAQIEYSFGP